MSTRGIHVQASAVAADSCLRCWRRCCSCLESRQRISLDVSRHRAALLSPAIPPECSQSGGGDAVDQTLPGRRDHRSARRTPRLTQPPTGERREAASCPQPCQGALVEPAETTPAAAELRRPPRYRASALRTAARHPDALGHSPVASAALRACPAAELRAGPGAERRLSAVPRLRLPAAPTTPTAAAVTDGECTPPISCDQIAQLFGFGDDCSDIPMCIPQDRVPAGFPIPIPSPPLCGPGAGGTPPIRPRRRPGRAPRCRRTTTPAQQPQPYYANCDRRTRPGQRSDVLDRSPRLPPPSWTVTTTASDARRHDAKPWP